MFIAANDFDKLCAFIFKAKKNKFSNKNWAEFGDIYKRTLLKYQHDKKESAKRMKEGRAKNKQYGRGRSAYALKKARARQLAINWQLGVASRSGWSPRWCAYWSARWERIGRKYGLIEEFKENGLI